MTTARPNPKKSTNANRVSSATDSADIRANANSRQKTTVANDALKPKDPTGTTTGPSGGSWTPKDPTGTIARPSGSSRKPRNVTGTAAKPSGGSWRPKDPTGTTARPSGDSWTPRNPSTAARPSDGSRRPRDPAGAKSTWTTNAGHGPETYRRRNSLPTSMPSQPIREITPSYLTVANEDPVTLDTPQKLLVILDLNGTLFFRNKNNIRMVTARPHLEEFLDFLFKNCRVMVWSSARPHNVQRMLHHGFGDRIPLLDRVWSRDEFRLPKHDYERKVLTIKDLEFVWEGIEAERKEASKEELAQEKLAMVYDQTNTLLIDDSTAKIQLQPYNGLALREFDADLAESGKDDELPKVIKYLEKILYQKNISAYMRLHPFKSSDYDTFGVEDLLGSLKLSDDPEKISTLNNAKSTKETTSS
ncbi:hypothetical protein BGZ94_002002 [Podila epigama]|nr:hypothetical protein BGZ94_002002 [Podila epigama]